MIELNLSNKNIIYSDSYLSVIKRADRFFYAVFDQNHTIREASLRAVEYGAIEKLLLRGFERYLIAIDGPSLHLPDGLSGKEFLKEYTLTIPYASYLKDRMLGHNASTHYSINKAEAGSLDTTISGSKVIHLSTAIADYLYPAIKNKVLAVIGEDYLYFCNQNQEGLRFINRYTCHSDQDYIYYLNLCFSQLNLDFNETEMKICGQVNDNSPLTSLLSEYFGNWSYTDPLLLNIDNNSSSIEKHLFHELYMVYLCEL